MAQRDDWINAHCAPCGNARRRQSDAHKQNGTAGKRNWVMRADSIEHLRQ
jgi:hypothetical protein